MLVALDIETTPIDPITKDIDKIWCFCLCWYAESKYHTYELVFPEGITKEDLARKRVNNKQLKALKFIQSILNNESETVPVFHGSQFEYRHLTESGFSIKKFHDSMLLGYVLFPRYERHSLEAWGEREYCDKKKYGDVDADVFFATYKREIVDRCLGDVKSTLQLTKRLMKELKEDRRAYDCYENIDIPFVPILVDLTRNGAHLDVEKLTDFTIEVEQELENQLNNIWSYVPAAPGPKKETVRPYPDNKLANVDDNGYLSKGDIGKYLYIGKNWKYDTDLEIERPYNVYRKVEKFNPASENQKIWALAVNDGFISEEKSEKTNKPKVDKFALEAAAVKGSKLADHILEYQTVNKLYTSFCVPLQNKRDKYDRIHANFNNAVTATGRLSCSDPNLQTIPIRNPLGAKLRYCFTPQTKDRVMIVIDLSGAEMRILGWYLVKLLGNKYEDAWVLWNAANKDQDLHKPTIDLLGLDPDSERIVAKTLSFGDMYGMGKIKFARTLKCSLDKAYGYLKLRHSNMPSINALKEVVWDMCRRRDDHTIHTLYGRRLTYPDIVSKIGAKRARAERQCFNGLIQGTQSDIIKILGMQCYGYVKEAAASFILQVHDEYVFDCPVSTADWLAGMLTEVFTNDKLLPGLKLTGEANIADSWGAAKG